MQQRFREWGGIGVAPYRGSCPRVSSTSKTTCRRARAREMRARKAWAARRTCSRDRAPRGTERLRLTDRQGRACARRRAAPARALRRPAMSIPGASRTMVSQITASRDRSESSCSASLFIWRSRHVERQLENSRLRMTPLMPRCPVLHGREAYAPGSMAHSAAQLARCNSGTQGCEARQWGSNIDWTAAAVAP